MLLRRTEAEGSGRRHDQAGTILLAEAHECEQRVMHDCRRLAICGPVGEDGQRASSPARSAWCSSRKARDAVQVSVLIQASITPYEQRAVGDVDAVLLCRTEQGPALLDRRIIRRLFLIRRRRAVQHRSGA